MTGHLAPIGYVGRIDRVRRRLETEHGLRAMLITDPLDIRWCSAFSGSTSWLAILPDRAVLGTDYRYLDRAHAELGDARLPDQIEVVADRTRPEQRMSLVSAFHGVPGEIGAQAAHLTQARWSDLASDLALRPADGLVEAERRSKDQGELDRIAEACRIADAALAEVAPMLGRRPTETDIRNELEYRMRRLGADGPSYDTIVASGPANAARPHHSAEHRTIIEGDLVVIDIGALIDGYHSDMTRSFVVGEPDQLQHEIYELVLESQQAGLAAVAPHVAASAVDQACRQVFERAGYSDWYLHSTGHGVGLGIHEEPFHSPTSTAELQLGDVVTVEPGLYRAGFGGVRVEDLVVVTEAGCRILTHTPKDTPCLPSQPTT